MDSKKDNSVPILTILMEKLFNSEVYKRHIRPVHEMSTEESFQQKTAANPRLAFDDRITRLRKFHQDTTLTTVLENTTTMPTYKRYPVTPSPYDSSLQHGPTNGPATTIHVVGSSGLEKCLWVALGGIAVLILMAFFMKLGKPIRRVRRHLSNTRTSPEDPGASLDMGSSARLVDGNGNEPRYGFNDPPPSYFECISMSQYDSEEPPPRYSASFEDYKNEQPRVHTRQKHNAPNALSENGVRVEFIAKNNDIVKGKRTELVFDNGRIVERRLSLSTILHIRS